jgi:hypothetical protein
MWETYALCLQVRASQTMHVLVEVHHLESIELIADFLDLLLLAWLDGFNTFRVPFDVCTRCFLALSACLYGTAGDLSIMDVFDPVVAHGACCDLRAVHLVIVFNEVMRKAIHSEATVQYGGMVEPLIHIFH